MTVVAVGGLVRGRELTGEAEVALDGEMLRLARPGGRPMLDIPIGLIEGLRHEGGQITLFLAGDDAVELVADDPVGLRRLARELLARVCALPELTRALRALGAYRSSGFAEHDRFFSPLLNARRHAQAATEPLAQVAAFDPAVLRARLDELVRRTAADRYPEHPPARRALEAELQECVEPLAARLAALAEAASVVRDESDELRLAAWRQWTSTLAEVFVTADRCWVATAALLRLEPYETPRPWWRRVMRRGERTR